MMEGGGGMGERWEAGSGEVGIDVYLWLIHVDEWHKPAQHCKAIIL